MSEECTCCGEEPPQTRSEKVKNEADKQRDRAVYRAVCECGECGSRLDPVDFGYEKKNEEVKFIDEESLMHGME